MRGHARVRGQAVMVEYALALIGIVVFLGVLLKVWLWVNTMIVQRQAAFQNSRVAAGSTNPGAYANYARPPLKLFKDPGRPGTSTIGIPVTPECDRARPFFELARQRVAESEQLRGQIPAKRDQMVALGVEMERLGQQIRDEDDDDDRDRLIRRLNDKESALNQLHREVDALEDRAQEKFDEARDLVAQGEAACP